MESEAARSLNFAFHFIWKLRIRPRNLSCGVRWWNGWNWRPALHACFCSLTFERRNFGAYPAVVSQMTEEKATGATPEPAPQLLEPLLKDVEEEKATIVPAPEEKHNFSKLLAEDRCKIFFFFFFYSKMFLFFSQRSFFFLFFFCLFSLPPFSTFILTQVTRLSLVDFSHIFNCSP